MSREICPRRVNILGTGIDACTLQDAVDTVCALVRRKTSCQIITSNVDHLMILRKDAEFREIYRNAALVVPDGVPLLWAAKWLGQRLPERVNGTDLMDAICRRAAEEGMGVFFLGGDEGAAQETVKVLLERFPRLRVRGTACPPYGFENDPAENEKIVKVISGSRPDILFTALGTPKGGKWIDRNLRRLGVPAAVEVGASFNFVSGRTQRAPSWMQACGLEWLWRLAVEPGRLWKRYLIRDMPFFFLVLGEKFRNSKARREPALSRSGARGAGAKDKKRIAIIGSRGYPFVYSGYETLVRELGERLVAQGWDVTVYCHRTLFRPRPAEVNGIRLVYFPAIEKKKLSQLTHSLPAMLHAGFSRCDLVLAVNVANGPLGIIPRIFGKKTVINVDGLEWLRPKWRGFGSRYFHWAARMATRFYDGVITDSRAMRDVYKGEFGRESTVIAYGADIRDSGNPVRIGKWGLEQGRYYLVVGRMIPDNNADFIIREFVATATDRKLVIVGDVPYEDPYARGIKAIRDSRLVFTGYIRDRDELDELYLHSYAYLHGHEFGGTNPTLLAGLGCGCAVLALDTVFSREVLDDGEFGLFFRKEEGNLKRLLEDGERFPQRLETFRKKARQRIRDRYDWEEITGQYRRLFETLLR
jgi:exopolysaccharide biosynthesis WecB/TagA/CpsF family protein